MSKNTPKISNTLSIPERWLAALAPSRSSRQAMRREWRALTPLQRKTVNERLRQLGRPAIVL